MKRPATRRGRPGVPLTRPGITPEESRAWQAAVAVLDRVAVEMERNWGVGRLPTLVSPDLAAKFARAEEQLDVAIASGIVEAAAQKAAAVARGWKAMDDHARASGHKPADLGRVWCAAMNGQAYAVCLHTADSAALAALYPDHQTVTLEELLRLLSATEAGRLVAAAKAAFPGAALTNLKPAPVPATETGKPTPGKPPADWGRGDELPF